MFPSTRLTFKESAACIELFPETTVLMTLEAFIARFDRIVPFASTTDEIIPLEFTAMEANNVPFIAAIYAVKYDWFAAKNAHVWFVKFTSVVFTFEMFPCKKE